MPGPFSFLSRKKPTSLPFKDYYENWFNTLKNTLLPLLHQSLSSPSPSLLPFRRDLLLQHFLFYYDSLDQAAAVDVSQILFPSWRNSLETPFLFLGDLHPYLFTNLLRSFIDAANNNETENPESLDKPYQVLTAWINPPEKLILRIEQIECGLRLMVPPLISRVRKVQAAFIRKVAEKWDSNGGFKKKGIREAVKAEMEEMLDVLMGANRLRRSVIIEIVNAANVYQGALFLEGLAQFLVGFKDTALVGEFRRCKMMMMMMDINGGGTHWGF
ncbi:hypothetical protein Goshw_011285 [Gossypium schwendimanii]|uniref:DOG1 domain-containing protein n=1 Tax=Gossypium schwendimanii TaxID=34291 RepID=A0A7J9MY76_GOSSC|nr:hypothetical protein [Gossypium schwendimanii]